MKKSLRNLSLVALILFGFNPINAQDSSPNVLVDVDFTTLFSGEEFTGTLESPNYFTSGSYSDNPITNVLPGWSIGYTSNSVGQAGEAMFISQAGSLESPSFGGLSTSNGGVKVTIVAKSIDGTAGNLKMIYGSSYSSSAGAQDGALNGNDWQTLVFYAAPSSSSYSNYLYLTAGDLRNGVLIQSIQAEQYVDYIYAPTAFRPDDADGTSFTARWGKVTAAAKYYLDVYYLNSSNEKVYFLENQETEATSYKVSGLDPDITYYYVVRAVNAEGIVSSNSSPVEVIKIITELSTPLVTIESVDADGNFTATWDNVKDADSYIVDITKKTTLTEDQSTSLIDENFDSLTGSSLGMMTSTSFSMNMPGWSYGGASYVYGMKGALALTGYSSTYFGNGSYLMTPEMDLSGNDGNVTVKITQSIVASYGSTAYTGEMKVILMNGNTETDEVTVTIDKTTPSEYVVELTGGTTASKIKFYYPQTSSSYRLKFENIQVLQSLPAGSVISSNYLSETVTANEYKGKVEFEDNVEYELTVTASARTVASSSIVNVTSSPSTPQIIEYNKDTSVNDLFDNDSDILAKVIAPGVIYVSCPEDNMVEVFDLGGRIIAKRFLKGNAIIDLNTKGVIIVKAGEKAFKLIL